LVLDRYLPGGTLKPPFVHVHCPEGTKAAADVSKVVSRLHQRMNDLWRFSRAQEKVLFSQTQSFRSVSNKRGAAQPRQVYRCEEQGQSEQHDEGEATTAAKASDA
jgi:hypothetical protein